MTRSRGTEAGDEGLRVASLGRHSLVYGLGMVLSKAVGFLMLPIYTRWLTPSDYGILQLLVMTFEVVTIIAGSRIAWGIFHFYHKEESETGQRQVLATAFLLLSGTYVVTAVATAMAASPIAALVFGAGELYPLFVRIAAANMAFQGLFLVPMAFLQLQERSGLFVAVSLTQLTLQIILNLIFLIPLDMGVAGVLLGGMTTNLLIGTVLAASLVRAIGIHFRASAATAFVRFGIPLVLMQIATFLLTFGDRYFLNRAGTTTDVGLYGLAYQFGFLVATIGFTPFQRVWDPRRFALAKHPDKDAIFARVFVYLNILLLSVALGIALFGGDAIRIMATPPFHPAAAFIPVLAAAYVFQAWGNFLNLGIFITERTEYFTIANWIAAGVALIGYLLLIPRWLAWGATLTTFASLATRCWLSHVFSQRLWRVEYRWSPVLWLSALSVTIGAVSELAPSMPLARSILFHAALFALYALLVWLLPVLTVHERGAVRRRASQWFRQIVQTQKA